MGFKIKMPKISLPKDIVPKSIIGAAAGAISPTLGALNLGREAINAFTGKAPTAPNAGEDPKVTALRDRLYGEADSFGQNLGAQQESARSQIGREGAQALQSGLKGTKQNYNQRGLLYSGLREGAEQGVRGKVASTMANQKAQSNMDLQKSAMAKYQTAAQVGLQGYQDAVNREAEIEGVKLQNQVARAQVMQQLGQIGGQAAGAYFGSRTPTGAETTTPNLSGSQSAMSSGGSFGQRGI